MPTLLEIQQERDREQDEVFAEVEKLYGREGLYSPGVIRHVGEMVRLRKVEPLDGGGLPCPVCNGRRLIMLDESRAKGQPTRFQCGDCLRGIAMHITSMGITLKEIPCR